MQSEIKNENMENIQKRAEKPVSAKRPVKSILMELCFYIIVALLCLFVVPKYIIQRTIVSGASMENTLKTGDNLLMERVSYHFKDPARFDVVIFYPHGKSVDEYFVKRVIGLPGETIQIIGPDIFINGEKLSEDYGKNAITYAGIAGEPLTLSKDEFFLMGDNREVSLDSRYEEVGPVHKGLIAGRAILRIWPLNSFGTFR